jgi:hypothetical protein
LLQHNAVGAQEWSGVIAAVPPHCATLVVQLARQYSQMWLDFAQELDEHAQVTKQWGSPKRERPELSGPYR